MDLTGLSLVSLIILGIFWIGLVLLALWLMGLLFPAGQPHHDDPKKWGNLITKPYFNLVMSALLLMMMLATTGCTGGGAVRLTPTPVKPKVALTLAPESALPDFVREASPQVKEAYRFAIANPEVLTKFPCYCGCGKMGHRHNLDCYIKEIKPTGEMVFENHAFGWSICIDITRDVMRLMSQGEDLKSIRAYIDQSYSQYAEPTHTEPIQ